MGGIVPCSEPAGSTTSTRTSEEEISSHSKNVQFHRPVSYGFRKETPSYRVLLLGFEDTGKTALSTRRFKQWFHKNYLPSVVEEISYATQIVNSEDGNAQLARVQVTDLPGCYVRRPHYIRPLRDLVRTHDGIVLTIDSTKTLSEVKQDLESLCRLVDNCLQEMSDMKREQGEYQGCQKCIIIALTKVDLSSKVQVSVDQVLGLMKSRQNKHIWRDIRLVETSAFYGINIFALFQNIVQMCHNSRTGGISDLYDFWKQPILAQTVLKSWGINNGINEGASVSPNQRNTDELIPAQQVNTDLKSKVLDNQRDQRHQSNVQISISSPATVINTPEWQPQSVMEASMRSLTIGHATLHSCPVQDMSLSISKRTKASQPGMSVAPPKQVLGILGNSDDELARWSPTNTDELRDAVDTNGYTWNGITEHRRSVSSVVSMIEDKDSTKEQESCEEMEKRLSSYREKMMVAKEKNQFAVANMYKQEAIKCQLLLSETRSRRDKVTNLLNRNAFDADVAVFEQICESKKPGLKGIIFAIDLMNFKLLNDEHGHGVGDRALREFGHTLKRLCKKMANTTGKVWNVYRVGGDEFAITALARSTDREAFRRAAQSLADIRIPWLELVSDCTSDGIIFARIGGVFGKQAKYEDADIIERNVKERNKNSRKTLMQPEKINRLLLYYLDKEDRDVVITEYEKDIEESARRREFSRCSEIQEYIKFLEEGFISLKKENQLDTGDSALLRGETSFLLGDTTLYSTNAIKRLTRKSNLEEIYDIGEGEASDSSTIRPVLYNGEEWDKPVARGVSFQVTRINNAHTEEHFSGRKNGIKNHEMNDHSEEPPPYDSDSENESLDQTRPSHRARLSRSMSEISVELFSTMSELKLPALPKAKSA